MFFKKDGEVLIKIVDEGPLRLKDLSEGNISYSKAKKAANRLEEAGFIIKKEWSGGNVMGRPIEATEDGEEMAEIFRKGMEIEAGIL